MIFTSLLGECLSVSPSALQCNVKHKFCADSEVPVQMEPTWTCSHVTANVLNSAALFPVPNREHREFKTIIIIFKNLK